MTTSFVRNEVILRNQRRLQLHCKSPPLAYKVKLAASARRLFRETCDVACNPHACSALAAPMAQPPRPTELRQLKLRTQYCAWARSCFATLEQTADCSAALGALSNGNGKLRLRTLLRLGKVEATRKCSRLVSVELKELRRTT